MKTIELFSGTKSFSKVAAEYFNAETFTVDFDPRTEPDLVKNVLELSIGELPYVDVDFLWASPPCTTYSVAAISRHRDGTRPKSVAAKISDQLVVKTLQIIRHLEPKFWVIENPVGMLRKMEFMQNIPRVTVTYCQYGDLRMKPTDLFGVLPPSFNARRCKNGMTCHVRAPRGSPTGTQGMKNATEKGVVPFKLCWELLNSAVHDIEKGEGFYQNALI